MRASEVTEDEPGIGKLLGNMEAARIMPLQNHAVLGLCSIPASKGWGCPHTPQELLHPSLLQD